MFKNKRILVTGGTGMIGRQVIKLLTKETNKPILCASYDDEIIEGQNKTVFVVKTDLRYLENCLNICDGMDYVFHLAGIKSSPKMCQERPATFMVSMLQFNTNTLEAAVRCKVKQFMYTSSVGVYAKAPLMQEDMVWSTFPSDNDRFPGWSKRMGELQVLAYQQEGCATKFQINRPTNIYGPFDNFKPINGMVIPSLIARAVNGENPLTVWGDGSGIRDFCYSTDAARAIIHLFKNGIEEPVNVGGPRPVTIKEIAEIIVKEVDKGQEIVWDTTKPSGDKIRVLDSTKLLSTGFKHEVSIEEGIHKTVEWYKQTGGTPEGRYNAFEEVK
jgi:GDP-L-fucose synthase